MVVRKCVAILFVFLFICFTVSGVEEDKDIRVPDWLCSDEPVSGDQVAVEDYPY